MMMWAGLGCEGIEGDDDSNIMSARHPKTPKKIVNGGKGVQKNISVVGLL